MCPWSSSVTSCTKQYLVPSMLMSHPPKDIIKLVASTRIPCTCTWYISNQFFPNMLYSIIVAPYLLHPCILFPGPLLHEYLDIRKIPVRQMRELTVHLSGNKISATLSIEEVLLIRIFRHNEPPLAKQNRARSDISSIWTVCDGKRKNSALTHSLPESIM